MQNFDIGVLKNWVVNESGRKRVRFRWEVFNIFNHPNFQLPKRNFTKRLPAISVRRKRAAAGDHGSCSLLCDTSFECS